MAIKMSGENLFSDYTKYVPLLILAAGVVLTAAGLKIAWDLRDLKEAVVEKKVKASGPGSSLYRPSSYDLKVKIKGSDKAACTVTVDKFFWRKINEGADILVLYNSHNTPPKKNFIIQL